MSYCEQIVFETYMQNVMRKKLIIEVEYDGERRATILDTELAKWFAYFNGTILRVLLPYGLYIDNVKTSVTSVSTDSTYDELLRTLSLREFYIDNVKPDIFADSMYVELTYYVKSNIEKYASRTMLARLAYEYVREIKKL